MMDVLVPDGLPTFKNLGDLLPPSGISPQGAAAEIGKQHMPSLNWNDIQWLRDPWKGNLILRGILSVGEASKAAQIGVAGIVLSNHAGRQIYHAVSPMEILPGIRSGGGGDKQDIQTK